MLGSSRAGPFTALLTGRLSIGLAGGHQQISDGQPGIIVERVEDQQISGARLWTYAATLFGSMVMMV
jgi:hypothetical protein